MLINMNRSPVKNPVWSKYTPNQMVDDVELSRKVLGLDYMKLTKGWKIHNGIPGRDRFFEVRIIGTNSLLSLSDRDRWWNDVGIMDRIFWVYQKPVIHDMTKQDHVSYALEYYECLRVKALGEAKFGFNPFRSNMPSLLIPRECVQLAWNETTNGYSDHLREAPEEEVLTAEQEDRIARVDEKVEKLMPEVQALSEEQAKRDFATDKVINTPYGIA
jgi:hypothetical protein